MKTVETGQFMILSNTDLKLTEFKIMSLSLPNVSSLANKKDNIM